ERDAPSAAVQIREYGSGIYEQNETQQAPLDQRRRGDPLRVARMRCTTRREVIQCCTDSGVLDPVEDRSHRDTQKYYPHQDRPPCLVAQGQKKTETEEHPCISGNEQESIERVCMASRE